MKVRHKKRKPKFKGKVKRRSRYPVYNAFCPTGEGGGIDNSCSSKGLPAGVTSIADLRKANGGIGSFHDDPKFYDALRRLHNKNDSRALDRYARSNPEQFARMQVAAKFQLWKDQGAEGDFGDFNDKEITLYRGVEEGGQSAGRSWTARQKVAEVFSRYGGAIGFRRDEGRAGGSVLQKTVRIKDIWMYSNLQGEEEVIFKGPVANLAANARRPSPLRKLRNPLKYDPTHTGALRKKFESELRKRFAKLKLAVVDLIAREDALGLKQREPLRPPAMNAFCPTDEGGGIDATCSPSSVGGINEALAGLPEDKPVGELRNDKGRMIEPLTRGPRNNCFINAAREYEARLRAGESPTYVVGMVYRTIAGKSYDPKSPSERGFQHAWVEVDGRISDPTEATAKSRVIDARRAFGKVEYVGKLHGGLELNPNRELTDNTHPKARRWLVDQDAPGLERAEAIWTPPAGNAFCPTGEGGGIDPTCSPSGVAGGFSSGMGRVAGSVKTAAGEVEVVYDSEVTSPEEADRFVKWVAQVPQSELAKSVAERIEVFSDPVSMARRMEEVGIDPEIGPEGEVRGAFDFDTKTLYASSWDGYEHSPDNLLHELGHSIRGFEEDAANGWASTYRETVNAFCPTGEGGGIDNTCSPSGGGGGDEGIESNISWVKTVGSEAMQEKLESGGKKYVFHGTTTTHLESIKEKGLVGGLGGGASSGDIGAHGAEVAMTGELSSATQFARLAAQKSGGKPIVIAVELTKERQKSLKRSPLNRTTFVSKKAIPNDWLEKVSSEGTVKLTTNLVINTRWAYQPNPDKVKLFRQWLQQQIGIHVVGQAEEDLWRRYVEAGYKKGAGRAWEDATAVERIKGGKEKLDFYRGSREQFLRDSFARPESVEKVKLLAGRGFDDLEGITSDMSLRMTRKLTDGLVEGKAPAAIARDLADEVDIGRTRASVISRTEIIRAHAEGQLQALEDLGVDEVGVAVEWSTAGDEKVCPKCEALEGIVLKLEEAHGMIPRHPNCRCSFIPANVGEESDEQKATQKSIQRAISSSKGAAGSGEDDEEGWGPSEPIGANRPRSTVGNARVQTGPLTSEVIQFAWLRERLGLNAFCPTGPGGGIDNTCSPKGDGGGGIGFLPDPDTLKAIKLLPGSTNPVLAQAPNGSKWVQKGGSGSKAGHLRNEAEADNVYRALGVDVPDGGLVETPGGPIKLAEFIEGGETLAQYEASAGKEAAQGIRDQVAQNFVVDALMANWDVAGLNNDNILIKDGKAYRIDNGGALAYRAQGALKGNDFGGTVKELQTLRDPTINPNTAKIYKNLTDDQIQQQLKDVVSKRDAVLAAIKDDNTRGIMEKRLDHLKSLIKDKPAETPSLKPPTETPTVGKVDSGPSPQAATALHTGTNASSYIKITAVSAGVKFTDLQHQKIEHLNPEGIKNGVLKVPKALNQSQMDHLAKHLPPGTVIKKVEAGAVKIGLKSIPAGEGTGKFGSDPTRPRKTDPDEGGGIAEVSIGKPLPLPKTYGGLQPGHKYVNTQGKTKEVESVTKEGSNIKVKFKGETGEAVLPVGKALPTQSAEPTTTKTTTSTKTKEAPSAPAQWSGGVKPLEGSSAHPQLKEHFDSVKLTSGEKSSIRSYTGSSYYSLNSAMRSCPPDFDCVEGSQRDKMNNILSALNKAGSLPKPTVVRRGISLTGSTLTKFLATVKQTQEAGGEFNFDSFASTSTTGGFGGNVKFEILAKRGLFVRSISQHPGEDEVILSPKSKFKVNEVVEIGSYGKTLIRLEEV